MNIREYVRDLERISAQRDSDSIESVNLFQRRLLGMMREYDITLGEALMWDYEGFENDISTQLVEETLEKQFDFYLWQNNVYGTPAGDEATEVFFGRAQDLVIRIHKGKSAKP